MKRHEFNQNLIDSNTSYFNGKIERLDILLSKRPDNAGNLFNQAYDAIGDYIVSEYPREETKELIEIANDLGLNTFRNALGNDEVTFQLKNTTFKVHSVPSSAYIDPIAWCKYFYAAILSKNKRAIDELIEVPEFVMRDAQLKCDEVDFAIVRFFKGLYQKDVALDKLLTEALELTDPKKNDSGRADYLLYLKFPELKLYRLIFSNSETEFNKALEEALTYHKKFWGDSKNANASEGWIAIPLICVCFIAKTSRNYKVAVTSDYLPKWLF